MAKRKQKRSRMGIISKLVAPTVFTGTFLSQLMSKEMSVPANQTAFAGATAEGKLKWISNAVTGHITGNNFFNDAPKFTQTINPLGIFNKYTFLGLAMSWVYPHIPKVPHKGLVAKAGGAMVAGAIFGGFFDPAAGVRQGATAEGVATQNNLAAIGAGYTGTTTVNSIQAASRASGFGGTFSA